MWVFAARFQAVMPVAIVCNSAVVVWGWVDHAHEAAAEVVDTCFLLLFAVELLVRLRRAGWGWLRRPWNVLDALVIMVALLPMIGDSINLLRLARAAKLVHLGRHASHLRVVALLR